MGVCGYVCAFTGITGKNFHPKVGNLSMMDKRAVMVRQQNPQDSEIITIFQVNCEPLIQGPMVTHVSFV